MVLVVVKRWLGGPEWIGNVALLSIAVCYLGILYTILIHPLLMLWFNRVTVVKTLRNPLFPILDNARMRSESDWLYLRHFRRQRVDILEHVLLELRAERDAFETRLGLVIGAITKIGILPGLVAISATLSDLDSTQLDWVYTISCANIFFYLLGFVMHQQLSGWNRAIMLVAKVLEDKEGK